MSGTTKHDIDALQRAAASTDESVRLEAVKGLYESQDIRAVTVLARLASQDGSVKVRYMAKKAVFLLRKVLREELKKTASFSGEFSTIPRPDKASPAEDATSAVVRPSESSSCVSIDAAAFEKAYAGATADERIHFIQAAVRYNARESVPILVKAAADETDERVRATLAISLGILGGPSEIPVVGSFLHDEDPRVRANAVEGLEYIGSDAALSIVVRLLSDPDNRIRANVVKALKGYGQVNLTRLLEQMVTSDKLWMRDSAAYCLSVLASPGLLPLMERALGDEHQDVRRKVVATLERMATAGNERAAAILAAEAGERTVVSAEAPVQLFDPDAAVRKREIDRIAIERDEAQIPGLRQPLVVEQEPFVRACAVAALGRLAVPAARDALVRCLDDDVARVRANAVEALAAIAPDALEKRSAALLADANNRVRANAIGALMGLRPDEALAALGAMAVHPDELHRRSAFWAVTDIGDERVAPFFGSFLRDQSPEIRQRAVHFVQQLDEQGDPLAVVIRAALDDETRATLASPLATERVVSAFADELSRPPAAETRRMGYDEFRELTKEHKLDVVDEAKSVINVANFAFLREVMRKETDFVVKVAARRALKGFERLDTSAIAMPASEGGGPSMVEAPHIRAISYRGDKSALKLSQELIVRSKQHDETRLWTGPFDQQWQMLNALREDTQDMLLEVIGGDELLRVSLCYFVDVLRPFVKAERSLDMSRFGTIVSLARVVKRLERGTAERAMVDAVNRPVYLLALMTNRRVILFLRGPIDDRQARYVALPYHNLTDIVLRDDGALRSVMLSVGETHFVVPEMEPDDGARTFAVIERRHIEVRLEREQAQS